MPATPEDFDQAEEIARWLGDEKGEPVRFKKIEPGDEQILLKAGRGHLTFCHELHA